MKKIFALLAAFALSTAAHATVYKFSWTPSYTYNNTVVTGSFEGTANGNIISNLSNISVFMDGKAFNGNGNLFGSSIINNNNYYYYWTSGGAQASFDGKENNFLFIDSDYPNSTTYSNYFYSVYGGTSSYAYMPTTQSPYYAYASGVTEAGNWSVTEADVPEPTNMALFALGLFALAYLRNKKNA